MKKIIAVVVGLVGIISAVAYAQLAGTQRIGDNYWFLTSKQIQMGNLPNVAMSFNHEQTPDTWHFGTAALSNSIIISEKADMGFDFAHQLQVDPSLFIHSHNQSTTQWIGITHDGANGIIGVGTGKVKIEGGVDLGLGELSIGNRIIFEGVTADDFETTLGAIDPTADRVVAIPDDSGALMLSTAGVAHNADAVWGETNKLAYEGATANDFETTISVEDPTADRTVVFSDQSGSPIMSTGGLPEAADAIWGSNSRVAFEGATANDFETTLTIVDPTADNTVSFQDASGTVAYLTDNVASATVLALDPVDCLVNSFATTIAANGDLTCAAIADADVPDALTISGGTVNNTVIGGAVPAAGHFTDMDATGTITSSAVGTLGWSVVAVANQACTATCTSACVMGFDDATPTMVDCADAAADKCLCAGAN